MIDKNIERGKLRSRPIEGDMVASLQAHVAKKLVRRVTIKCVANILLVEQAPRIVGQQPLSAPIHTCRRPGQSLLLCWRQVARRACSIAPRETGAMHFPGGVANSF